MDLENPISRRACAGPWGIQCQESTWGKMPDVIFAGTESRKPLNYACVTVVLDNQDGFIQQAGKKFVSNGIFIVQETASTRSMARKYVLEMCMICSWIRDWDVTPSLLFPKEG